MFQFSNVEMNLSINCMFYFSIRAISFSLWRTISATLVGLYFSTIVLRAFWPLIFACSGFCTTCLISCCKWAIEGWAHLWSANGPKTNKNLIIQKGFKQYKNNTQHSSPKPSPTETKPSIDKGYEFSFVIYSVGPLEKEKSSFSISCDLRIGS